MAEGHKGESLKYGWSGRRFQSEPGKVHETYDISSTQKWLENGEVEAIVSVKTRCCLSLLLFTLKTFKDQLDDFTQACKMQPFFVTSCHPYFNITLNKLFRGFTFNKAIPGTPFTRCRGFLTPYPALQPISNVNDGRKLDRSDLSHVKKKRFPYFPWNTGWLMTGFLFHGLWNNPHITG